MPPAEKTKVLISVKTYPSLSRKYGELVCTAGFREDGSWIRIYPIPFRNLDDAQKFEKWRWIEVDLVRNSSKDHRHESHYVANLDSIVLGEFVSTEGGTWRSRRELVLRNIKRNMKDLIEEAHDPTVGTSLATFKPSRFIDVFFRPDAPDWNPRLLAQFRQGDLFRTIGDPFARLQKIPWRFYIHFADEVGKESRLMIEDWEIGALYRNGLKTGRSPEAAAEYVRGQLEDFIKTKDLHLFLGTSLRRHFVSLNPFIIIGLFYPKHQEPNLFDA
jgi:hypothetical protein